MKRSILIVGDGESVSEIIQYFEAHQVRVTSASQQDEARMLLRSHAFDLIMCFSGARDKKALDFCRIVRSGNNLPFIFLAADSDEEDRVAGLEAGADDFVVEPIGMRELYARVCSALRRALRLPVALSIGNTARYTFGGWTFNVGARELVRDDGLVIPLSGGEQTLLIAFVERSNLVLTRAELLALARGRAMRAQDRSIDNQISRLRRKLEPEATSPQIIKTIWGGGYAFVAEIRSVQSSMMIEPACAGGA